MMLYTNGIIFFSIISAFRISIAFSGAPASRMKNQAEWIRKLSGMIHIDESCCSIVEKIFFRISDDAFTRSNSWNFSCGSHG